VVQDNLLIQITPKAGKTLANRFSKALELFLPESLLVPSNYDLSAFENWDEYYPFDRGQSVDPASGMGQRTYNRWEMPNQWQLGQSTWRYQDPNGSSNPPPFYPPSFQGEDLTYYFLYHCEKALNPDSYKDCLNLQVYTEMGSLGNQGTEFQNWARGGWKSQRYKPTEWEVFYKPDAFSGSCDKTTLRRDFNTEYFQDPTIKRPLVVRLPKTLGLRVISEPYCTVFFNSYLLKANKITNAQLGYTVSIALEMEYDPEKDQKFYKATNLYYYFQTEVDGERIFKRVSYELFWIRQVLAETPLRDGFSAFWWFTWDLPVEENTDRDGEPAWSDYQWCYQDLSQPPEGLGKLICSER